MKKLSEILLKFFSFARREKDMEVYILDGDLYDDWTASMLLIHSQAFEFSH